jgi:hypothetical protein
MHRQGQELVEVQLVCKSRNRCIFVYKKEYEYKYRPLNELILNEIKNMKREKYLEYCIFGRKIEYKNNMTKKEI